MNQVDIGKIDYQISNLHLILPSMDLPNQNLLIVSANFMKLGSNKTRFVSFTRKINQYTHGNFLNCSDYIKDLGLHIDCKPHIYYLVDFYSHVLKLLGMI
jgi:hypothetical protein